MKSTPTTRIQPFSQQKGGQRKKNLSSLKKALEKLSGRDVTDMLQYLLAETRFGKKLRLNHVTPTILSIVESKL